MRHWLFVLIITSTAAVADEPRAKIGEKLPRQGDEIMVCGQLYHTTTRVVLWTDPGGYDAYRVERRFAPLEESGWKATQAAGKAPDLNDPSRYGMRQSGLSKEEIERVRGGGWDLPQLAKVVDQFVIHFDVCGTSKRCFQVLHDARGLSVHFMLDVDGTIYQTLDLKERAFHATIANGRSVGIEVANIGAYPEQNAEPLLRWYQADAAGRIRLVDPETKQTPSTSDPAAVLRPMREQQVTGKIQGQQLHQYDFTPEQYEALARLSATLCTIFPKIRCDYPRDSKGVLVPQKLGGEEYKRYQGILGHYHVQTNKVDPGPAFQWDKLIERSRQLMTH
jgi:N-acetylmuramoyl-L-alanine amidase